MRLILETQNCRLRTAVVFAASAVTRLYNLVMPGLLTSGVKWLYLKQHTGKGSNVFSSMVYNQLSEIVITLISGLTALMIINPADRWEVSAICAGLLGLIIIGCFLLMNRHTAEKINAFLRFMLRPLPRKLRKGGVKVIDQLITFQTIGWRFHAKMVLLTTIFILIGAVIYLLAAKGANINVPIGVLVWLFVIVALLGRLPISIANLGVREVTLVGFLAMYNIEAPAALLMSMIIFSNSILMALLGAVYQLYWAGPGQKNANTGDR